MRPMAPRRNSHAAADSLMSRRTWLAGLAVGAAGGFTSLEVPIIGWPIVMAFLVPAVISKARVAAIGGLLAGLGGVWTALLGRVALTCVAPDCRSPGIEDWLLAGVAIFGAGIALTAVDVARRRRVPRAR